MSGFQKFLRRQWLQNCSWIFKFEALFDYLP